MTTEQLKMREKEFLGLIGLNKDGHDLIYARDPLMIQAMAKMIYLISTHKLHPVRCMTETFDEAGFPVHRFSIEMAYYGDD